MNGNQSNLAQLESLVLGSLELHPLVGSLDPWVEGSLAGMEDTLLEMLMGQLGIPLELEGIPGQAVGMQDSLVQYHSLDDLAGSLAEVADKLAVLQDTQG